MVEMGQAAANVTALLQNWAGGDASALNRALPQIYDELRRLAEAQLRRRQTGGTLSAPALVHEAYLRLTQVTPVLCENRSRFFALAATMMRGLLIDHVRARRARKRGGGAAYVTLSDVAAHGGSVGDADLLDIDAALHELAQVDRRQAQITEMRFFGGLSIEETAESLGLSPATIKREWTLAKAWLKRRLARDR